MARPEQPNTDAVHKINHRLTRSQRFQIAGIGLGMGVGAALGLNIDVDDSVLTPIAPAIGIGAVAATERYLTRRSWHQTAESTTGQPVPSYVDSAEVTTTESGLAPLGSVLTNTAIITGTELFAIGANVDSSPVVQTLTLGGATLFTAAGLALAHTDRQIHNDIARYYTRRVSRPER